MPPSYSISPAAPWSSGVVAPGMCGDIPYGVAGMDGVGNLGDNQAIAITSVSSAGSILAGTAPLWTTAPLLAIPIIGVAVAAITLALVAIFSRKGPKQKIATTQFVEKLGNASGTGMMQQNLQAYMAGPHTVSSQAQALENFDAMWAWLEDQCGDPAMGEPGKRCLSERQRGGKWDMARDNRDPIANDPNVVPDPTIVSTAASSVEQALGSIGLGGGSGSMGTLLLAGAALLLAFSMGGKR
jgi:hypothetical protein